MSYPQPDIGDRVSYIDGDGEAHRGLVIDACEGSPYVTVVTGNNGELGKTYNHGAVHHSSVFPHTSVTDDPEAQSTDTIAFVPGWSRADE